MKLEEMGLDELVKLFKELDDEQGEFEFGSLGWDQLSLELQMVSLEIDERKRKR